MIRRPPRSTRTDTLFPYTTLFRSHELLHHPGLVAGVDEAGRGPLAGRSEEHTSELQSLMRISYAVFCLKKKIQTHLGTKNSGSTHQGTSDRIRMKHPTSYPTQYRQTTQLTSTQLYSSRITV